MLRSVMLAVFYLLGYSLQAQHPGYRHLMDIAVFDQQFSSAAKKIHSIR
jgi:hypothetical protein